MAFSYAKKMKFLFIFSSVLEHQNDYFFKQFITLPLMTTAQVPAEIQKKDLPHDIILPPLCFTVDMMCYVVFVPNLHFKIMAKMPNYGDNRP